MGVASNCNDFTGVSKSFNQAIANASGVVRQGQIGDREVRVTFAGQLLAATVMPSFAQFCPGPAAIARETVGSIEIWDCVETGIPRPPINDTPGWQLSGNGWTVSAFDAGRLLCEERAASLLWLDRRRAKIIGCFENASTLSCADRARPLQRMMGEFSRSLQVQEIHAAMIGYKGVALLLVGGGGRGKTTTALDSLHEGLDFFGDDSIGLSKAGSGEFLGHCLYASARVLPKQLARWPHFASQWQFPEPPELKALFQPADSHPQQLGLSARICAIAIPFVATGHAAATRIAAHNAFRALFQESRDNRRFGVTTAEFALLADLTKTLPCYRLEVDESAARVAAVCRELLLRHHS
jgi:hypothetical protein